MQTSIDILPVVKQLWIVNVQTTHVPSNTKPRPNLDFSKTIVISFTPNEPNDFEPTTTYLHFMKIEKKETMNQILEMNAIQSSNFRHK